MSGSKSNTNQNLIVYLPDLLDGIDTSILAGFLKDEENLSQELLDGFRVNKKTVGNPVLKQRLLKRAEKDSELLNTLGILWVDSNKSLWSRIALSSSKDIQSSFTDLAVEYGTHALRISLLLDDRRTINRMADKVAGIALPQKEQPEVTPPAKPVEKAASPRNLDSLKTENRNLKEKIRDLQHQLKVSHRQLEERDNAAERIKFDTQSLKRLLAEQKHQMERNEKSIDRMRRANEGLEEDKAQTERELREARKKINDLTHPAASENSPEKKNKPQSPDWVPVVSAMLKKSEYESAKVFCETLRELEPESLRAHLAIEQVYARTGERNLQVEECLWIAKYLNNKAQPTREWTYAFRALEANPRNQAVQTYIKELLKSVNLSDESAVSAIKGLLTKLKSRPAAYKEANNILQGLGKQFTKVFDERPGILHADKIIALDDGIRSDQLTIRRITDAVDENDIETVEFVRHALGNLKRAKPSQYRTIMASLSALDNSCVSVILNGSQPVVVDGSNVAWHETNNKPRLQNILDLRSELRADGYFPIYIYVDAALPYQVDKKSNLEKLIERGAVAAVNSRTDADEEIVSQAKRLECPVVTNDRMADWDPNGEVTKFRFDIDQFGITVYER